jgi:archaellin
LEAATNEDDLVKEFTTETLSYDTYVPVYNDGARKIRSVSAKESNYFNILQSIAETFGAWLEIEVGHNPDGSIDQNNKIIKYKNYVGKNNYSGFRYGVNLKDI